MMSGPPAIAAPHLSPAERESLALWAVQLEKLIESRKANYRSKSRQLETHLRSAIEGARTAIYEACEYRRQELKDEATAAVGRFFSRRGDAANAATTFEAVRECRQFLRGPFLAETLDGLTAQAEEACLIINRILAGGILWSFGTDAHPSNP